MLADLRGPGVLVQAVHLPDGFPALLSHQVELPDEAVRPLLD